MAGQLISLWSPGEEAREIADALAVEWSASQSVVQIAFGASPAASELERWLPPFRTLDPLLLRNYLSPPAGGCARLALSDASPASLIREALFFIEQAFDKALVICDRPPAPEILPVLDASHFLLWLGAEGHHSRFKEFLERLTELHFPHAFCHAIQVKSPARDVRPDLSEILPGKKALAVLPDARLFKSRFIDGISMLAQTLENPALSKTRLAEGAQATAEAVRQIRHRIEPDLLQVIERQAALAPDAAQKAVEAYMAEDASLPASRDLRRHILSRVLDEVLGLGPIEPLLKDPEITEIMINGHGCVFVERSGKLHPSEARFSSEQELRTAIDRIVAPIGRRVDESMPLCDARLADGSRVNIIIPPLALDGPAVTIRKFPARAMTLGELVQRRSLDAAMAELLKRFVLNRRNIVVAGGTGSGKTTLLNALSSVIPDDERIVTIEDAAELRLQKPHVIRLESRPANAEGQGAIPIRRLVMNALRMRPDRLVVGECRGGEALDMLQAMNTGHDGSLTTVHANSPRDALGRLETLALMSGMELPVRVVREQIRSAVHLIVQQARLPDGSRKVVSIVEITGMDEDTLLSQELFAFRDGQFQSTGAISRHSTADA